MQAILQFFYELKNFLGKWILLHLEEGQSA